SISATASGGTQPYTFNWTGLTGDGPHLVNPTYSQYFTVNVIDSSNCVSDKDSVLVALNPPILLSVYNDTTICPYDTAALFATANGGNGGPYVFSWVDDNGNTISSVTSGNSSAITPTPVSSFTNYTVTVEDNCETPLKTDSLQVNWHELPTVLFDADVIDGCYPVTVQFTNNTLPLNIQSCIWNLGNGVTSTNNDSVSTVYNQPGQYHVSLQVTSPESCVNDTTFYNFIEAYDYPVAGFLSVPNPVSVLTPSVQFMDTSSNDVVLFEWNYMDSNFTVLGTSFDQNPSFNFPDQDEYAYLVQLIVENQDGCTDTTYNYQLVEGQFALFLPNSFTPNDDGLNDRFFPVGDKIDPNEYDFQVYNRWGEVIFETKNPSDYWDGKLNGTFVSNGTYLWKVIAKNMNNGKFIEKKGFVIMSR
ncbi:MAG: gliding motility-associated C-terminal domain-containing protein, partial [Bacteroidota bacterium]|nr:gliding motility-associated C-terminal domain-containing protein [Bacteroidota bacterium]